MSAIGLIESEYDINDAGIVSAIDDVPLWSAPFGMKLLESARMMKNIRALDIGCGLGFPVVELAGRLGTSCQVFGIDPWTEAVERARDKIRAWGLTNIEIVEGKAEDLPFPDAHFDLVVSNNGTNNVDDEAQVMREIARVAKPGAQILLTMNLPDTMIEFYNVYRDVLRRLNRTAEIDKLEAHIHAKRKPLDETRQLIEGAGLELTGVHEDTFTMKYADGSSLLNNFTIKLAFLGSWTGILDTGDVAPVFDIIEHELNDIAEKSGELKLTIPWVCIECRSPAGRSPEQ